MFYLWFCLWFKGFLGKLSSQLRDYWPLATKLGLWHLLTLFERKTKKYTPFLEVYLFHPRVSQHLTSSRLLRRKAKKPRVLRLNPNSQSAGHCGRDSSLWEETVFKEKKAPPPPPRAGFKWTTLQKPPQHVPVSAQRQGHQVQLLGCNSNWAKGRGRNKCKSWLYHVGLSPAPHLSECSLVPSDWVVINHNHPMKTTGEGEGEPETHCKL